MLIMITTESSSSRIELVTRVVTLDGGRGGVGRCVGSDTRIVGHEELVARSKTVVVDDVRRWWGF